MSQVHLVPTTTMVTTRVVTQLILKEVVRLHGIPESIVETLNSLPYSGVNYTD